MRWFGFCALWLVAFLIGLRWSGHLTIRYNTSDAVERMRQYTVDRSDDFHRWLDEKANRLVKK